MATAAPLIFNSAGISASGTTVLVASIDAQGQGPCRLTIKNVGSHDLTAAIIKLGPDSTHQAQIDSTTFTTLAAGAVAQLAIDRPVNLVTVTVSCSSGTLLDIALSRHQHG
jgi:hypothetical protein